MPNSTHTHIPIRTAPLGLIYDMLPIHSYVTLHGVSGFCLHRSHKNHSWVVSHIETGAECGTGNTQSDAIRDAQFKSHDRSNIYAGIARTKSQLSILGVQI